MRGKVVVITGANSGIGKETAVGVAAQGATTVLACRNQERAAQAAAEVRGRSGNDDVHVAAIDLADLDSVRQCAKDIESRWDRLDVLVNNAGGIFTKRRTTVQGFEYTFGVNHLGPFYLTLLLLDRLRASAPARVVNLSSVAHHSAPRGLRWDDLQFEHRYSAMGAYAQSKLCNILMVRELARRVPATEVTANAVHPGPVRSGFGLDGDMTGIFNWGNRVVRLFEIPASWGAKTSVRLATDPALEGRAGEYWVYGRRGVMSLAARNPDSATRLWDESLRLLHSVGVEVGPGAG